MSGEGLFVFSLTNFNPNDIRIDGCVNAYGIKNLVTQFTRYCVIRLR